jgi:hypothetical protein
MTISGEVGGDDPLYLDDLQVGQRFTSKTHVVDAAQIKAFAPRIRSLTRNQRDEVVQILIAKLIVPRRTRL